VDLEPAGELVRSDVLAHIDGHHLDLVPVALGDAVQHRFELDAGHAPAGPEGHEDRRLTT
jgi:hypothetical protein